MHQAGRARSAAKSTRAREATPHTTINRQSTGRRITPPVDGARPDVGASHTLVDSSPAATVEQDQHGSASPGSTPGSSLFEVAPDGDSPVVASLGVGGAGELDVGESAGSGPPSPE